MTELHPSIVALVSLASGIASNHPAMGQCQLKKLRSMGITEKQIDVAIEIARHIRDEAAQKTDLAFDNALDSKASNTKQPNSTVQSCCSSTDNGTPCC